MRSLITIVALSLVLVTTLQAQTVPQYVPTSALKAWYSFTGNTNDLSGAGLNLTNYGATLTADRFSASNSAYRFDGVGSNMKRANFPALGNPATVSVSCWIKRQLGSGGAFICKGTSSASANHIGYYIVSNPSSSVNGGGFYPDGTNGQVNYNDGGTVAWEHIVLAFSNPAFELYINGNHVGTWNAVFGNLNNYADDPLYIGYNVLGGVAQNYFNGVIDDIGIWDRQLSPCDVKNLYNSCVHSTVPNVSVAAGGTATFSVINQCYRNIGISYQWQGDFGAGFTNLSNAGQYSGVTTQNLSVSGVYAANNNSYYRCVINNGTCDAITNAGVLTLDHTGVQEMKSPAN